MKKFRIYYDKDKETAWLNEMAAQGYAMTSFFAGLYTFDECAPDKYTYQLDFCDKLLGVTEDYREFMRDNHIEIVQTWAFWIYLRKRKTDGAFELYTDINSSIEHYTKIRNMFKGASIIMVACFLIECLCALQTPIAIPLSFIAGAFAFAIIQTAVKTNRIIAGLKEQKGETASASSGPASALIAGLLLNSVALISGSLPDIIEYPLRILAIALIVYGIIKTFS